MSEQEPLLRSAAVVITDVPDRYAKQLLSHLGRKAAVETIGNGAGRLVFAYGTGTVRPAGDHLLLEAAAPDAEALAHVEDVLARHLERFGAKRELVVTWERDPAQG